MSSYDAVRSSVVSTGVDSRVEVNQRALIDKILARYASEGAVYRELIQNSNDAEARTAQIRLTTSRTSTRELVTQVVYRNDGHIFRPQDWERLKKIAEGNPDVSKVGAFGVGAYTMFSICEEPLVISGNEALSFLWKGDALWTKVGPCPHANDHWTSFVLPSRDPYPLPDLVDFGQFLCIALTFTQCLQTISVFVDEKERLTISKKQLQAPKVMTPPKSSSWWNNDGAVTRSPKGIFTLGQTDGSITETVYKMTARLDGEASSTTARYVSALANVRLPHDVAKGMYRVTKKNPPSEVNIQVFVDASASNDDKQESSPAKAILSKFSPSLGNGSIFIGFRTSQTTGLAVHLAAPLVPTVEREAIDFQDPNLKEFNSELLSVSGILMRLTLEHSMSLIGKRWEETREEREALEKALKDGSKVSKDSATRMPSEYTDQRVGSSKGKRKNALSGFASFMSSGMRRIADAIASVDLRGNEYDNLLYPEDARPLSQEEEEAVLLMRSFCPQFSTPDRIVGSLIANGFSSCMPYGSPPVLTNSGVVRGTDSRLPFAGIERFVSGGVVRRKVQQRVEEYLLHVAACKALTITDLEQALQQRTLDEEELIIFLKWWTRFCHVKPEAIDKGSAIKKTITWRRSEVDKSTQKRRIVVSLESFQYFRDETKFSSQLPMPEMLLPQPIQENVTQGILADKSLNSWFRPLPFAIWASFISTHPCLTAGRHEDSEIRLQALSTLSAEHSSSSGQDRIKYEKWLHHSFLRKKCIPYHSHVRAETATECPGELYLLSAEIAIFEGLGSFKRVSSTLGKAGISDEFLVAIGVRKAISIDFLFTHLDNLKWSGDPKPLIGYLSAANLTTKDLEKLKTTKYLPAHNDTSSLYAPSELHFPNLELEVLPFVKTLHWPSLDGLSERSREGNFLKQLGCRTHPELKELLTHLTQQEMDDETRFKILSFVNERLNYSGCYRTEYWTSPTAGTPEYRRMKFLPAVRKDPLMAEAPAVLLQAPMDCYTESEVLCLGFPVIHPSLQKKEGKTIGERFMCEPRPGSDRLAYQLLNIASFAEKKLSDLDKCGDDLSVTIVQSFNDIFDYLSTRTKEFGKETILMLKKVSFIPVNQDGKVRWFQPGQLYFRNSNSDTAKLVSDLFSVIDFNPFLAAVGVKSELRSKDLFQLIISSPRFALSKIGEEKYRAVLTTIATDRPFNKVTEEMRQSPFLLAYRAEGESHQESGNGDETQNSRSKYGLARAEEISVVDNAFFATKFNVLTAPPESDLEEFYILLGSSYLSKRVKTNYTRRGPLQENTASTTEIMARIQERKPLFISPAVTSRKLKSNAQIVLKEGNIKVYEVNNIEAVYRLDRQTHTQDVTCCADNSGKNQSILCISRNYDWFDVGAAIGNLIFLKCHLEDSFFIGSLLEAPLKQLKARGFPVDRILKNAKPMSPFSESQGNVYGKAVVEGKEANEQTEASSFPENAGAALGNTSAAGFVDILAQMFPDCDLQHIRSLLGTTPTLETLRQVANTLSDGNYPKQYNSKQSTQSHHGSGMSAGRKPPTISSETAKPSNAPTRGLRGLKSSWRDKLTKSSMPYAPIKDSIGQKLLENRLRNSVKSARKVSAAGFSSQDSVVRSAQEDLKLNPEHCEVIPGKNLNPCKGKHGTGKTRNGIRLFSSREDENSEQYLNDNFDMVEAFSDVLQILCGVYSLKLDSVAIFHAGTGKTIAFNAGSALHFNLRFFGSLHWKNKLDERCYIYWFTIMAHELAHNFAHVHNREHGYYTESYVMLYLPNLLDVLR